MHCVSVSLFPSISVSLLPLLSASSISYIHTPSASPLFVLALQFCMLFTVPTDSPFVTHTHTHTHSQRKILSFSQPLLENVLGRFPPSLRFAFSALTHKHPNTTQHTHTTHSHR